MDAEIIILSNVHRTCSYTCEALSKRLRASCKHHLKVLKYIFHKSYLMQEFWIFCWINIWISSGMCDDSAYHITTCLAKTINNIKYVSTFKNYATHYIPWHQWFRHLGCSVTGHSAYARSKKSHQVQSG
jgi:hypothetical protein